MNSLIKLKRPTSAMKCEFIKISRINTIVILIRNYDYCRMQYKNNHNLECKIEKKLPCKINWQNLPYCVTITVD